MIQRVEKREETRLSLLRKENRASFENILEIRWTRWQVSAILHIQQRQNRGSTEELNQNTINQLPKQQRTQANQEACKLDHIFTSCGTTSTCITRCYRSPRTTQMTEKSTKEEGFRMDTQSKTIRPQQNPRNFTYFTW